MSLGADYDPIEDVDNLNQKMQIRSLNEARKRVRSVRNNAQEQIASAAKSQHSRAKLGGQSVYLEVVKAYALELAPLVAEFAPELWNETTLMNVTVHYEESDPEKEIVDIEPGMISETIDGVREFLMTDFPVTATFHVTYRDTAKGDSEIPRQQTWTPSFAQTDAVLLLLDNERKEFGLFLEGPDEVGVESDEPI